MPSVPAIGEETVCEINREFLTRGAADADAEQAQAQYSKIIGRIFPNLTFKVSSSSAASRTLVGNGGGAGNADEGDLVRATAAAVEETLDEVLVEPLTLLQKLGSMLMLRGGNTTPLGTSPVHQFHNISWHKQRLCLAFIVNSDHVLVVDYEQSEVGKNQNQNQNPVLLYHETQQRGVSAVEWRPNSGSTLAVGCRGGVCIWTASYQGSIPPVRTGAVTVLASPTRGAGGNTKWSLVDFLAWGTELSVSALSWSPCGRLLACGSGFTPTFAVWDVSLGESTPLRRGMAGVQLLRWSPLGDYLLSAKVDGSFHLWETMNWTSEPWSSAGGAVVGAAWSPDGRMVVSAFDRSTTLGTLHFAGKPPSLEVHLLPLELVEVERMTGAGGRIERIAWDGTGERLAVSFAGEEEEVYSGLVAVYDTRRTPIISASLLGFVRGPGGGAKPLSFAFHDRLKQGALLGVVWSTGVVCVYPLLFRTH